MTYHQRLSNLYRTTVEKHVPYCTIITAQKMPNSSDFTEIPVLLNWRLYNGSENGEGRQEVGNHDIQWECTMCRAPTKHTAYNPISFLQQSIIILILQRSKWSQKHSNHIYQSGEGGSQAQIAWALTGHIAWIPCTSFHKTGPPPPSSGRNCGWASIPGRLKHIGKLV